MPIATPEVYAQMLDRAKAEGFAYPAINVTSSQTLNAALHGLRRRRQRRDHPGLHRRRRVRLRHRGQGHGHRRGRARRVRARGRREVPGQRRAAHRPLPQGQAGRLRAPAARDLRGAGRARRQPAVPVAHVGRLRGRRWTRTCRSPPSCWTVRGPTVILEIEIGVVGGEEDGVVGEINEKLYTTPDDALRDGRGARPRRARPLPPGRHVRQRARRLQAGQRQAPPGDPQARSRTRSGEKYGTDAAVRPGLPRRLRLGAGGDPRGRLATAW